MLLSSSVELYSIFPLPSLDKCDSFLIKECSLPEIYNFSMGDDVYRQFVRGRKDLSLCAILHALGNCLRIHIQMKII